MAPINSVKTNKCVKKTNENKNMLALVKFSDGIHEICPMKNVKMQDGYTCIVKYKGCKYQAHLLASNESRECLENMMDVENLTDSSALIQPKHFSHQKPKIINDVKVSLTIMKISKPHSSLMKTGNELTDSCSHKFNNAVGSIEPVSKEFSTFDASNHQINTGEHTHTVIEKSEMTAPDEDVSTSQIIFSSNISDHSGFEKEYPIAVVDSNKNNLSSVEPVSKELSSFDESNHQTNTGQHTHTIIKESEMRAADEDVSTSHIIFSSNISDYSGIEKDYPIPAVHSHKNNLSNDWNVEISNMLKPLNKSNLQNSDLNSSEYPFHSSLFDKDLLSSANLLTSTPEAATTYNTGNFIDNNNFLMDSSTNVVYGNSDLNNYKLTNTFTKEDSGHLNENNINLMDTYTKYDPEDSNANNNMDKTTTLVIKAHGHPEESDMHTEESNDTDHDDPEYEPSEKSTHNSDSVAESDDDGIGIDRQNENYPDNVHNITDTLNVSVALKIPGSSRCDQYEMHVAKSRGRSGDKKYNFCVYCHKKQLKIARHLELKHYKEEEVKKFIDLPKNCAERRKIIGIIRKKGNFLFNTQTIYNDGELIVSRRPKVTYNRSAHDFKVCANCKAYFSVKSLRMHFAKCTGRSSKKNRMVMVMSKQVVAQLHPAASSPVIYNIFLRLREDETVRAIRYDELVIIYANKMCEKYQAHRDYTMIRQRIRLLGRFLLTIRSLNKEITDLTSVYDPKFCDDTLRAIATEAEVTPGTKGQMTPAVASALEFQTQQQRRMKVELPLTEDVQKLCKFLQEIRDRAYEELIQKFSEATWMTLAEATLTSLQVFNRRRAGEIERTEIEDFKSYEGLDSNTAKDLFNSLSQKNQALASKYVRFAIRGKKNRPVAVLLSADLFRCIELLLKHRENMKISSKNIYVFGIPGKILSSYKHLDACALMRKFSVQCGATYPERLRGTKLRKHIATICVTMNLTDNQVTDLASYMGHAEKIHKDIYRQPLVSREILQMSKLSEVAQGAHDDDEDDDAEASEEEREFQPKIQSNDRECQGDMSQDPQRAHHIKSSKNTARRVQFSSPYTKCKRIHWTEVEKNTVLRLFRSSLDTGKLPSLPSIRQAIIDNPHLQNRTPEQIKSWLQNKTKK